MKYYINENYLMDDETFEGTLEEAMEYADSIAAYSQQPIVIKDEDGNQVARRDWIGVEYDPNETENAADEIISFGTYGYFDAWVM